MAKKRQTLLESMQSILANFDDYVEAEKGNDEFYIDR
jgi:hypothetical protein